MRCEQYQTLAQGWTYCRAGGWSSQTENASERDLWALWGSDWCQEEDLWAHWGSDLCQVSIQGESSSSECPEVLLLFQQSSLSSLRAGQQMLPFPLWSYLCKPETSLTHFWGIKKSWNRDRNLLAMQLNHNLQEKNVLHKPGGSYPPLSSLCQCCQKLSYSDLNSKPYNQWTYSGSTLLNPGVLILKIPWQRLFRVHSYFLLDWLGLLWASWRWQGWRWALKRSNCSNLP